MYMFVCLGATSVADYYCKIEREKKNEKGSNDDIVHTITSTTTTTTLASYFLFY